MHQVGNELGGAHPTTPLDGPCCGSHPAFHQQAQCQVQAVWSMGSFSWTMYTKANYPFPVAPAARRRRSHGGPAPSPAKKWITERRHYDLFSGTHWVSWLPPKGTRRMTWVTWLWGNERWDGCGAPWDHNVVKCPLYNTRHGTTVHKRLIQCPKWALAFRKAWTQSWGTRAEYTEQWYDSASPEDLHHVACLRVPRSLLANCPRDMEPTSGSAWHITNT